MYIHQAIHSIQSIHDSIAMQGVQGEAFQTSVYDSGLKHSTEYELISDMIREAIPQIILRFATWLITGRQASITIEQEPGQVITFAQ